MVLSRSARRRNEVEIKKLQNAAKKLTPQQLSFVNILANDKAEKKFKEKIEAFNNCIDRNLSAFLITNFPGKNMFEIGELEKQFSNLIEEDITKFEKLFKGEKEEMANKKIEDLNGKVKLRCDDLVKEDIKQSEAIKILKSEFKDASTSMLTNMYKFSKEEIKKESAAEKIVDIIEQQDIKPTLDNTVESIKQNNLKIKKITVEGENGLYEIEGNTCTLNDKNLCFCNLTEIEEYRKDKINEIDKEVNEFKEVIQLVGKL